MPPRMLEWMALCAYRALWTPVLAGIALFVAASPRHRALIARMRGLPANIPRRALWVHACSVGEVNAARPLLAAMAERMPDRPVFLTVSTRTGQAHAAAVLPGIPRAWFPFDHPLVVRRFFRQAAPQALVLIETELWPCAMHTARRMQVPVILANGRLSDKHFARYQRARWIVEPMVRALTAAAMQSSRYAERIQALGMDSADVHICGSVKFDGAPLEPSADAHARLSECVQPRAGHPLIVVGSSRPGDEARAVAAWSALREHNPGLQLAIAVRHPDRIAEAERECTGRPVRRRSACTPQDPWRGDEILLVDTFGELMTLYAFATLAVIGGSFDAAIQGHNPIEPAALGIPVVFGPHMGNFEEAADLLLDAGAARRVESDAELTAALGELLADSTLCRAMGDAGRAAVMAQQGAAARMAALIAQTLESR